MATVLAGLAFGVGGAIALRLYHDSLVATVENSTRGAAHSVAAAARRGPLPDPIPMPVASDIPRVQVLDAAGKVISGDPETAEAPPMTVLARSALDTAVTVRDPVNLPERHAIATAVPTKTARGAVTVLAVGSLDAADGQTADAVALSAVLGGICLALIAAVAWAVTGRTLRRVERLRGRVSAITASGDLTVRVNDAGTDELTALAATLNEMLDALARSAERQRRFVADAAHELRTPIAGLSAAVDVARLHPETLDQATWTTELAEGHRRVARLVNDLLELARLDADAPVRRQRTRLDHLVADAVRRHLPPAVTLGAEHVEPAVILGDPDQVSRILTNLIDNALRYARHHVQIDLVCADGQAVVTVNDDGPGVPVAERQRIFDRFVRLDDHRAHSSGGSGLGLAMVKDLAHAHGGTVTVTDAPGGGAAFSLRFPLVITPPSAGDSDLSVEVGRIQPSAGGRVSDVGTLGLARRRPRRDGAPLERPPNSANTAAAASTAPASMVTPRVGSEWPSDDSPSFQNTDDTATN